MPTLFILCGLPFSGKSTLARKIAEATGSVLVSYDALWMEKNRETGLSLPFDEFSALAEERLAQALANGSSAVYDTLNNSRGWRDRLRGIADRQGARSVIVYLNTPLAVIEQRRAENDRTGERHSVSAATVREEAAKFETPEPAEAAIEFTPETNFPSWVERLRENPK